MDAHDPQAVVVLASASPRRRDLLRLAGIPFRARSADVEERPGRAEDAAGFTRRVAGLKAAAIAARAPAGTWVLGADTTVEIDGIILGKPAGAADAARMLRMLSGRTHQVRTAVTLYRAPDAEIAASLVETRVRFSTLDSRLVGGYIASGEPMDKAGAYGIQGQGALLIESIEGSYTNVVGLPLVETARMLERAGIWRPFDSALADPMAQPAVAGGGR